MRGLHDGEHQEGSDADADRRVTAVGAGRACESREIEMVGPKTSNSLFVLCRLSSQFCMFGSLLSR